MGKWYQTLMVAFASFFSMDENATEAEIHAKMQETPTLDDLKANIRKDLETEATDQTTALQAELDQANADLKVTQEQHATETAALKAELEASKGELEKAQASIKTLEERAAGTPSAVMSEQKDGDEQVVYSAATQRAIDAYDRRQRRRRAQK